jgi:RNA polymerase sigma-70 factor (ECF subfamily)
MLHDPDDAPDAVQETFVRVYRALPRYEERQRFESWLFQILGNCCRTANTAHQRHASRVTNDEAVLDRIAADDDPRRALDREWSEEVRPPRAGGAG